MKRSVFAIGTLLAAACSSNNAVTPIASQRRNGLKAEAAKLGVIGAARP